MTTPSTREALIEQLLDPSMAGQHHMRLRHEAAAELTASLADRRRIEELTAERAILRDLEDNERIARQAAEARRGEVEKERDEALRFASCSSLSQLASCYMTAQVNWDLTLDRAEAAGAEVFRLQGLVGEWVALKDRLGADSYDGIEPRYRDQLDDLASRSRAVSSAQGGRVEGRQTPEQLQCADALERPTGGET